MLTFEMLLEAQRKLSFYYYFIGVSAPLVRDCTNRLTGRPSATPTAPPKFRVWSGTASCRACSSMTLFSGEGRRLPRRAIFVQRRRRCCSHRACSQWLITKAAEYAKVYPAVGIIMWAMLLMMMRTNFLHYHVFCHEHPRAKDCRDSQQ